MRALNPNEFIPGAYQGSIVPNMARTIEQGGQNQAEAALRSGAMLGGTVSDLAGIGAQVADQYQQQKALSKQSQAFMALFDSPTPPAPRDFVRVLGPKGLDAAKAYYELAGHEQKPPDPVTVLQGFNAVPEDTKEHIWPTIAATMEKSHGLPPGSLPQMWDDNAKAFVDTLNKGLQKPAEPFTLKAGETRYGSDGKPIATAAPEPPKAPAVGSFEDYVTRKYGPNPTADQIEQAKKAMSEAAHITVNAPGNGSPDDVKMTVQGMKEGTLPPLLPGRASKEYVALMAEAKRQGFDLATAATDWNATQKHVASMNGSQQTRLNQAVEALPDLLDTVDALASKWKGGRFPVLNRANLAAAKSGVYGPEAATVARQLETQIADVVGDLGTVYMGGNSPTDHGIELASKGLSADWDEKSLHDMVALAKKNVEIRRNSIHNVGVQGVSADNPYAPKMGGEAAPAAPPPQRPPNVPASAQWDPQRRRWVAP